jgi:hypothetical protein
LRISDREKTLSLLNEMLSRYGGKVVSVEGDILIASLPAANVPEFQKGLETLSSPGGEMLSRERLRAESAESEGRREKAAKARTDREDYIPVRIRLSTE